MARVRFPTPQDFSLLHNVQTGSEAHQASYPMGMITHLYLVPKPKMVELYLHSPVRLHGIVLNQLSKGTTLNFTARSA
jgi:hypothetical protein